MLDNYTRPIEIIEFIENGKENKRSKVETFQKDFEQTLLDTKTDILRKKSQSIKEDISDFIRNCFREM